MKQILLILTIALMAVSCKDENNSDGYTFEHGEYSLTTTFADSVTFGAIYSFYKDGKYNIFIKVKQADVEPETAKYIVRIGGNYTINYLDTGIASIILDQKADYRKGYYYILNGKEVLAGTKYQTDNLSSIFPTVFNVNLKTKAIESAESATGITVK